MQFRLAMPATLAVLAASPALSHPAPALHVHADLPVMGADQLAGFALLGAVALHLVVRAAPGIGAGLAPLWPGLWR